MGKPKPRLLAVNQSTSILFRSAVEGLVDAGVDVRLLAGTLESAGGERPPFTWLRAAALEKAPAWRRIRTWGLFTLQAWRAMARHPGCLGLLTTNPPLVPWIAPFARRLFGLRYVLLVYDIYPDAMERMGMIRPGGLIDRALRRLSRQALEGADAVITLGERMAETLRRHVPPGRDLPIHIIPNWADTDFIRPVPRKENPFAAEHGLADQLVVMYSGAFGATHDIETLIDAAESLQDLRDVRFVLIGGGTRESEVRAYASRKALPNLLLLPWQPVANTRFSLTAADIHIISLDAAFEGISIPSKTYTSLAAGAAILCLSGPRCEVADLVAKYGCGLRIDPGDPAALAEAVRGLHRDRARLAGMQHSARRAAEEHFSKGTCLEQYRQVIMPLFGAKG